MLVTLEAPNAITLRQRQTPAKQTRIYRFSLLYVQTRAPQIPFRIHMSSHRAVSPIVFFYRDSTIDLKKGGVYEEAHFVPLEPRSAFSHENRHWNRCIVSLLALGNTGASAALSGNRYTTSEITLDNWLQFRVLSTTRLSRRTTKIPRP